jgi:hypothetical protein
MIIKGLILSMMYPGNEGLLIRRQFKALERSTMRDFEKWTGFKVPSQKQRVEIPGVGSAVNFAHADNLEEFKVNLQGMNLGWVGIEQGDDFDTAEVFEMFFGRVRRILTPNMEIQQMLISRGVMPKPVANFESLRKEAREYIETAIIEELGLPVRQVMVIANTAGHNWIWKRWKNDPLEGYKLFEGKPFENQKYIPEATIRAWEQLRVTSPKKYARYVLNSWEDYDIEGSYYAELMSDALKEKRVEVQNLHDKTGPVYTFWDLGVGGQDSTSIWFVQFVESMIHLVDFYSNTGKGMDFYSQVLSDKGYSYGEHYLPHDARQRIQAAQITTRLDILKRLRPKEDIYIVEKHSVAERHEAVRMWLRDMRPSGVS